MKPLFIFLISILLITLFLNLAFAQEIDFTIPYNKQYDFKRPCFNNGTYCSPSATCNITIVRPDGSLMVNNQLMTNQVSFHNLTVLQENVSLLGVHSSIVSCTDTGGDIDGHGDETFYFEVTGDGFSFRSFPLQILGLIISIGFVIVGTTKDEFKILKLVGGMLTMVMGVLILYPGFANVNWTTLMGKGLGFGSIGLGFIFLIQDAFSYDRQVETYQQDDDGRFHDLG